MFLFYIYMHVREQAMLYDYRLNEPFNAEFSVLEIEK